MTPDPVWRSLQVSGLERTGKGTEIEIAVPIERGGNYVESDSSR